MIVHFYLEVTFFILETYINNKLATTPFGTLNEAAKSAYNQLIGVGNGAAYIKKSKPTIMDHPITIICEDGRVDLEIVSDCAQFGTVYEGVVSYGALVELIK